MSQWVAVIGCGYWGKNLVRNFAQLRALRWICDSSEALLKAQSQLYPEVRVTTGFEEVLSDSEVRGIVIAGADLPDEVAYAVTRTLFRQLPEFRTLHLAFAKADATEMLDQCMFAEVHPGAARYYREARLPMPRRCLP